jgi:hypothetical protein
VTPTATANSTTKSRVTRSTTDQPPPMLDSNILINRLAATNGNAPPESIFAKARRRTFPTHYDVSLHLYSIVGGTPADPAKLEGWLKSKFPDATTNSRILDQLKEVAKEIAQETGQAPDPADIAEQVAVDKHLNCFKRDALTGNLIIEGRQVNSMLKEVTNIRFAKERWGPTKKGAASWLVEHMFILDDSISLGVTQPTEVVERFVHTWRGNAISHDEVVRGAQISFTIATDALADSVLTPQVWEELWTTAEFTGLGAVRSQGYGRFAVTKFDKVKAK